MSNINNKKPCWWKFNFQKRDPKYVNIAFLCQTSRFRDPLASGPLYLLYIFTSDFKEGQGGWRAWVATWFNCTAYDGRKKRIKTRLHKSAPQNRLFKFGGQFPTFCRAFAGSYFQGMGTETTQEPTSWKFGACFFTCEPSPDLKLKICPLKSNIQFCVPLVRASKFLLP